MNQSLKKPCWSPAENKQSISPWNLTWAVIIFRLKDTKWRLWGEQCHLQISSLKQETSEFGPVVVQNKLSSISSQRYILHTQRCWFPDQNTSATLEHLWQTLSLQNIGQWRRQTPLLPNLRFRTTWVLWTEEGKGGSTQSKRKKKEGWLLLNRQGQPWFQVVQHELKHSPQHRAVGQEE